MDWIQGDSRDGERPCGHRRRFQAVTAKSYTALFAISIYSPIPFSNTYLDWEFNPPPNGIVVRVFNHYNVLIIHIQPNPEK